MFYDAKSHLSRAVQLTARPVLSAALTILTLTAGALTAGARAENIQFPAGSNVVDVATAYSINLADNPAVNDGALIQQAIRDNQGKILWFRNGTYNIQSSLESKTSSGGWFSYVFYQGQSRANTIFKLKDGTFTNASAPQAVIKTGSQNAIADGAGTDAFCNSVFNLTILIGANNAGAIGIDYNTNNQGAIKNVTISADANSSGAIDANEAADAGVSLRRGYAGPCLLKNLSVTGFKYGIHARNTSASVTMEGIALARQTTYAIFNEDNVLSIRGLTSTNTVPMVKDSAGTSWGPGGLITLIDAKASGGSAANYAIESAGNLYLRNVSTSGYKVDGGGNPIALRSRGVDYPGNSWTEFVSNAWQTGVAGAPANKVAPNGGPAKSLALPIKETPEYWDENLNHWYSTGAANGSDDTDHIQDAIDAINDNPDISAPVTLYFPTGTYKLRDTITIRGKIAHVVGLESVFQTTQWVSGGTSPQHTFTNHLSPKPIFRIETPTGADMTTLERMIIKFNTGNSPADGAVAIENASSKTLVMRHFMSWSPAGVYRNLPGSGELFLEDFSEHLRSKDHFLAVNQKVWARQFNIEVDDPGKPMTVNDGGTLWVLGYKTEGCGPFLETRNGGKTEILGALHFINASQIPIAAPPTAAYIVNESKGSFIFATENADRPATTPGNDYDVYVREIRGGVTFDRLRSDFAGRQGNAANYSRVTSLYAGYTAPPNANGNGDGLLGAYYADDDWTGYLGSRVDATLNYNWPDPQVPSGYNFGSANYWAVRWTGYIQPRYNETYTFTSQQNDGARVWVNNHLLIDKWNNNGATSTLTGQMQLTAGEKYPITVEFHDGLGLALYNLKWQSASQGLEVVPQSQLYSTDQETARKSKINFQPAASAVPAGFFADDGSTLAQRPSGLSYGWDATNTANAADRNASGVAQEYDTLNLMQPGGVSRFWELKVVNGTYRVRIVAGDPSFYTGTFKINADNVLTVNGSPSSSGSQRWVEGTKDVSVTDGRLTITNASGASGNKICWLEITPLP